MKVGQVILYLKDETGLWWKENEIILSIVKELNWKSFIAALEEILPCFGFEETEGPRVYQP